MEAGNNACSLLTKALISSSVKLEGEVDDDDLLRLDMMTLASIPLTFSLSSAQLPLITTIVYIVQ